MTKKTQHLPAGRLRERKRRIQIPLDASLLKRIDALAKSRGVSRSDLAARGLEMLFAANSSK